MSPTRRPSGSSHTVATPLARRHQQPHPVREQLLLLDATMYWNLWPSRPIGILPLQFSEVSHKLHDPLSRSLHSARQPTCVLRVAGKTVVCLGVDSEWYGGNPTSILQLATANAAWLVDLQTLYAQDPLHQWQLVKSVLQEIFSR